MRPKIVKDCAEGDSSDRGIAATVWVAYPIVEAATIATPFAQILATMISAEQMHFPYSRSRISVV